MAHRDGVDIGVLGMLRGAIKPASKHEVLAWTLIGTALGSLAIDAGWGDDDVLALCKALQDNQPFRTDDPVVDPHERLASKLLAMALNSLGPRDPVILLALLGVTLQQIRAAAGDPKAIEKLRELTAAIGPHVATPAD